MVSRAFSERHDPPGEPRRGSAGTPHPRGASRTFVALMYHNLAPVSAGRYSVSIKDFEAQLGWLRQRGFTVEGVPELLGRLADASVPDRYVLLTFDDGHKSNLIAARMVREFGAQATFFVAKQICGTHPKFLDPREVVELSRLCSIGSHGVTHRPLSRMGVAELRSELGESKQWLEELTGREVRAFSAPGGFLDRRVVKHALQLGYLLVANSVEWWNEVSRVATRRVVNRVEIRGSCALPTYRRIVRGDVGYLAGRRLRRALLAVPKRLRAWR